MAAHSWTFSVVALLRVDTSTLLAIVPDIKHSAELMHPESTGTIEIASS
jgi:hypothetical protein